MKKKYLFSMATAFLLAVAGCSDDLEKGGDGQGKPLDGEGFYLRVDLVTSADNGTVSRAGDENDPTGGEQGDGNLIGYPDENRIKSVSILVYDGSSINDQNGVIVASGYVNGIDDQGDTNIDEEHHYSADVFINVDPDQFVLNKTYRVLAIANANVIENEGFALGTSLGSKQFKDATMSAVRVSDVSDGGFVMSSHQESGKTFGEDGVSIVDGTNEVKITEEAKDPDNPAKATAWVERLAARIDYIGTTNKFTVGEDETNPDAEVTVTGIAPVNLAKHDSYVFKRVTAEDVSENDLGTAPFTILGNEIPENIGTNPQAGKNYVLDPTIDNLNNKEFDSPFTETDLKNLTYKNLSTIITLPAIDPDNNKNKNDRVLWYTCENTMGATAQTHGRTTGVIFKAEYNPTKLFTYDEATGKVIETQDEETLAKGFYRVGTLKRHNVMEDGSILYADLIAAEANCIAPEKAGENLTKLAAGLTKTATFMSMKWNELYTIATAIGTDLGYAKFLKDKCSGKETSDEQISETDAAELIWSAFEESLSDTDKFPTTNTDGNVSIEKEGNKAIHYYGTDHTCYYQYWLRHANNGQSSEMGIMEFCIVRNNVYQLDVTGVNGLGMPDPYDHETTPDEGEDPDGYWLSVKIHVKDWVKRLNNNIILQ